MSWWSTLLGGAVGFWLGGPIGALIGAALGGSFGGQGPRPGLGGGGGRQFFEQQRSSRERAQLAFFAATFGVMGHVAKADGRVTAEEIRLAGRIMERLGLDADQRQAARALFNQGKAPGFPLDDLLDQLRMESGRQINLLRMFLEIQFQAAWADGGIHPEERRLLRHIAARLGLAEADFIDIERMVGAGTHAVRPAGPSLEDAYATLGVPANAPVTEIKRAYRRLMNRHHPDKLAAKGLPEEMMRAATERTQQIKAAWERVKAARAA